MRGAPFTQTEKQILQDYVKSDTDALDILYLIMIPKIEHPQLALFRSSYIKAVSYIERYGIPLCPQVHVLKELLKERLPQLIEQVDKQYGVYVDGTFTHTLFADYWIVKELIPGQKLHLVNSAPTNKYFQIFRISTLN